MNTRSLDNQLGQYWPLLGKEQKQSILSVMKSFLKAKENLDERRISVEQYNKEIDTALAKVKGGDFYTHEEMEKMSEEW
jgi:hypothetical protein